LELRRRKDDVLKMVIIERERVLKGVIGRVKKGMMAPIN
jgi:hypothetical protein